MQWGITAEQRALFASVRCPNGHKMTDGLNYPTPEGLCPSCEWPDVRDEILRSQSLLLQEITVYQPAGPPQPALSRQGAIYG